MNANPAQLDHDDADFLRQINLLIFFRQYYTGRYGTDPAPAEIIFEHRSKLERLQQKYTHIPEIIQEINKLLLYLY